MPPLGDNALFAMSVMVYLVLLNFLCCISCLVCDNLTLEPLQPWWPQGPYIKRVARDIVKRHAYWQWDLFCVVNHRFEAWLRNGERSW
jgi:hypothetical protein